VTRTKYSKG